MAVVHLTSTTAWLHPVEWRMRTEHRAPIRVSRAEPCVMGRSTGNTVVIQADDVARGHAAVLFEAGVGWVLEDWSSSNGTFINGQRITRTPLTHGTVFSVASHALRFELTSQTHAFNLALEDALFDAPDDDASWLVYADWLQENGNPLGEHLMRAPQGHPSLDGLTGYVTPKWTRGLLTSALLRGRINGRGTPASVLRELAEAPAARFLMHAQFELPSFAHVNEALAVTQQTLEQLHATPFRGLRTLTFFTAGPMDAAPLPQHLARLQIVSPRVTCRFIPAEPPRTGQPR